MALIEVFNLSKTFKYTTNKKIKLFKRKKIFEEKRAVDNISFKINN